MKVECVPEALTQMDEWLSELAALLPCPVRNPLPEGDFNWRFPEESTSVLLVAKAVRICSALGAAWELAKKGFATEAASLLRLVNDFSSEITFMAESIFEGRETAAQTRFREQFFRPLPRTVDDFLEREKEYYVSRREIAKAQKRLVVAAGFDGELLDTAASFITFALDKYVHGSYSTSMELYHGGAKRFMVGGMDSGRVRKAAMGFLATKATEAVQALEMVSLALGAHSTGQAIRKFMKRCDPDAWGTRTV